VLSIVYIDFSIHSNVNNKFDLKGLA